MYKNIGELLFSKSMEIPNNVFITVDNIDYTYEDFYRKCVCVAKYISSDLNIKQGETISICYDNKLDFLTSYFAGLILGVRVVTINPELTNEEKDYILFDSGSKVKLDYELKYDCCNFNVKHDVVDKDDEAIIIYTSGTTGKPKGVILTHENLLSDAEAIANLFCFDEETRTMCILPLFHNNGQVSTLLSPLISGGRTIIFNPTMALLGFWSLVSKYGVTFTSVMPSMLSILLNFDKQRKDDTLKAILCGGQPLKETVQYNFEKKYGVKIYEGYGLTETTSFICINDYPDYVKGSIGRPFPCSEMKIVDGEICVRGRNVTKGYNNLPEKNKSVFKDGWFYTGDYGEVDKDGYFYFKERKDFLIIKGGENIYPAEIENVIMKNKNVIECAVIGIDDEILGQNICAVVKLNKGCEKDIIDYCLKNLARYKVPKSVFAVEDIPKGPTNKIMYSKLIELYG